MRHGFVEVDSYDNDGIAIDFSEPTFVQFDDIVMYQIIGWEPKSGEPIETISFHIWTSDGSKYFISQADNVNSFLKAVTHI